jgi:hypothetical protein
MEFHGYGDCVQLDNGHARVVLGHHAGGRVLEYSLGDVNVIALDPAQAGWTRDAATAHGGPAEIDPWGGRFDVGPEKVTPAHPTLWHGPWTVEVLSGERVRLTSERDPVTGLRLVRDFVLAADSTQLTCTQTIHNESEVTHEVCHWGRTLVTGGGIAVVPLSSPSRFPQGYVMYDEALPLIDFEPTDPAITVTDGILQVNGTPKGPKLGMDSTVGWLGYLLTAGVLFVKRFPVYPDRVYNEVAGLTVSLWCYRDLVCEVEPLGPRERLHPGESASFTEDWWLLPHSFPQSGQTLDLSALAARVEREAV